MNWAANWSMWIWKREKGRERERVRETLILIERTKLMMGTHTQWFRTLKTHDHDLQSLLFFFSLYFPSFLFFSFFLWWINRYSTKKKKHSIGEMLENRSYKFSLIKTFYKQTHSAKLIWCFNLDHHKHFVDVKKNVHRSDHDCSTIFSTIFSLHYWILHIPYQCYWHQFDLILAIEWFLCVCARAFMMWKRNILHKLNANHKYFQNHQVYLQTYVN